MSAAMFRTLAIICLVSAPVLGVYFVKGLKVRFAYTVLDLGTTSFIELPQNSTAASAKDWAVVTGPDAPTGFSSLDLWCPSDDYTICLLYDDTGCIAGLQIAFEQANLVNAFDMGVQGFTNWTATVNGTSKTFYTIRQYYCSPEWLATDAATRNASRDDDLLVQGGNLYLSGFNGELYNVSTTISDFTNGTTYTKESCLPWMGRHYYYNMTSSTECTAETIFPWFPLICSNQLIGVGLMVFGTYTVSSGCTNYFEDPGKTAVEVIVPTGPDCLYEMADSPGVVTMHTYFIKHPLYITCLACD